MPLEEPLEILGQPRAVLHVESSAEVVTFVVRLCDVAPDGGSALVTKGVLNATHRDSHEHPSPLVPGQLYELEIPLDATGWLFEPGHRIRLSLSNADFPNSWPSPTLATSRMEGGPILIFGARGRTDVSVYNLAGERLGTWRKDWNDETLEFLPRTPAGQRWAAGLYCAVIHPAGRPRVLRWFALP